MHFTVVARAHAGELSQDPRHDETHSVTTHDSAYWCDRVAPVVSHQKVSSQCKNAID